MCEIVRAFDRPCNQYDALTLARPAAHAVAHEAPPAFGYVLDLHGRRHSSSIDSADAPNISGFHNLLPL